MAFDALKKLDLTVLSFFEIHPSPKVRRAIHGFFTGAVITLMIIGLWFSYDRYEIYRGKNAQKDLASCMEQYEKAVAAGTDNILWPTVELSCKSGYEKYRGTAIAPYFLGYQAEALIKQHKIDEAIVVMHSMLNKLSKESPLYYIYATKHALLQMDSTDSVIRASGFEGLAKLAADVKNAQRDEALYYVGLYNWYNNDFAQAKDAWRQLVELPADTQDQASPWTALAIERYKLLS